MQIHLTPEEAASLFEVCEIAQSVLVRCNPNPQAMFTVAEKVKDEILVHMPEISGSKVSDEFARAEELLLKVPAQPHLIAR